MKREISQPAAGDGGRCALSVDILGGPSAVPPALNSTQPGPRRQSQARNALRHGLTATKFLPDTLHLRTEQLTAELRRELQPVGCLEDILVAEAARRAAGMELAGHAEGSILSYCGHQQAQLDALLGAEGPIDDDAIVTAAFSSQPLDRFGRYRRHHERGFYGALIRLRELQASRQEAATRAQYTRFRDERTCEEYLLEHARQKGAVCPRCGDRRGHWLARGRRECNTCHLQIGLRYGSVMEGSRLRLSTWFNAIGEVLADPAIRPQQLQQAIGVPRLGTVRKLLGKILEALQSADVDRLLVGLQRLAPGAVSPEFGDASEGNLTKRAGGSAPPSTAGNSLSQ
jgi:hypothetical protein